MTRRILYLAASDWYFWCHRVSHALAAQAAGFDVTVATPEGDYSAQIAATGLRHLPVPMSRQGKNPLEDAQTIARLALLYRSEAPDLVHHVALKPILYGTLAARMTRVPAIVNAMGGAGYVFLNNDAFSRTARPVITTAFRAMLNRGNTRTILQNPEDVSRWMGYGVKRNRIVLIRGAGVNVERFAPTPEPSGTPVVVLPARLLFDKGVGEFVEAARILRKQGTPVRMALVGDGDFGNPKSVRRADLDAWKREGIVEHWGWRDDMDAVLRQAHIACLPSYGEGLPKALLEAAASGRPIVATDVPGVREVAKHDHNALLVPVKDAAALAQAIHKLAVDAELRKALGARGRSLALADFAEARIHGQTVALYRSLLQSVGRGVTVTRSTQESLE
jgi:glycosyltransferase involved in cell wall biosynthesis